MTTSCSLTIKCVGGHTESFTIQLEQIEDQTVLQLKQRIQQQHAGFLVEAQRLIFQGQILDNAKKLTDYNIADGCALHLTMNKSVLAAASTASASALTSASASASSTTTAPASALIQLRQHLNQMRQEQGFTTMVQTLVKICENIIRNPNEEKYRKLRISNAALKQRVFDLSKGTACVVLLGFQESIEQDFMVLVPSAAKWEHLTACKRVLDEYAGANSGTAALGSGNSPFSGAIGGSPFGPMSGGGLGGLGGAGAAPNAAAMAAQAQSMLQNPMFMQMLQNDPMIQQMTAGNPMLAQAMRDPALLSQSLQMMQQNPQMVAQLDQMMRDPSAMAQMQQAMFGSSATQGSFPSLGNPLGSSPFGAPSAASSTQANPFAPPTSSQSAPSAWNPPIGQPSSTVPLSGSASSTSTSTNTVSTSATHSTTPSTPAGLSTATTTESPSSTLTAEQQEEEEIALAIAHSLEEQQKDD